MVRQDSKKENLIRIGRFAPSPTGGLHFGSLIAAVASYLCARQHSQSQWYLRIEDVDTERKQAGASRSIIQTLEDFGFEWDAEILYQSQRSDIYQAALDSISDNVYPCSCTRKELQALSTEMTYGYNYPGLCRNGQLNKKVKRPSIRVRTNNQEICFQDECQVDKFCQNIEEDIGDFIIKRRGGLFAYQLAVLVDDHLQGINHIVRGADLFDNTPRQIFLQSILGYQTPDYLHFPVATTQDGKKLSKQNHSPELSAENTKSKFQLLMKAMSFLGQPSTSINDFSHLQDFWQWAIANWNTDTIPKVKSISFEER